MIITKQKEFDDLLKSIGKGPVFIIGCSECATLCHTGGEEEVLAMKDAFEQKNIKVTGWVVLDPACHLNNDKRLLKPHKEETVSEIIEDIDIIPGNDTLFLGEIKRAKEFEKRCVMCGDCIQDLFEGFCPIARCPKSVLNGPCGGSVNGKCEIDSDVDCVWDLIYKKLKERGQLDRLKKINKPKDWSKSNEMRRVL